MPVDDLEKLSRKQLYYTRTSHKRINLAYGAVRSGKNFAEACRLATYLKFQPGKHAGSDFIFAGSSIKSVYRIVLKDLFDIVGPGNFTYRGNDGSGTIYGRPFYSFGFSKANSHESMRGMTAGGAMLTELTLCHPDFWDELQLRVSLPGGQIFGDTNPGAPNHWVKKKLIDNKELEKQLKVYHFLMKDNPFIMKDKDYIAALLAQYPPGTLLHKRMILGEWAMAEGRIYDTFTDKCLVDQKDLPFAFDDIYVGIDYGTQNSCVFLLIGRTGKTYWVLREYYYSGRETGVQQTTGQYLQDLRAFTKGEKVTGYYADPSASYFGAEMAQAYLPVMNADNSVLPGIQCLQGLFGAGRIKLCCQTTPKLQEELLSYAWDEKAGLLGVERPLKISDHGPDALRYAIYTVEDGLADIDPWEEIEKEYLDAA